ncbi:hypothetical protein PV779_65340, partial [Streptomyces sp. ID01-9D]|nr:hypothetical protein [Streptomyces sp. ID01-9D]
QLYGAAEAAGSARGFWAAVCLQCLLLPVLLLRHRPVFLLRRRPGVKGRRRTARDPEESRAGAD